MVNKAFRTRDKYAKAAAELDALEKCLGHCDNAKELLPAVEADKLIKWHDSIMLMKVLLEDKAAKDFAGKEELEELHISDIFFKGENYANMFVDYKKRKEQLRGWI